MHTSENKQDQGQDQGRDYSHEHNLRMKRNKRFVMELKKDQAELFEKYLQGQGLTYSKWIKEIIENKLKE